MIATDMPPQVLAWHYGNFILPPGWEVTGHTLHRERGRIEIDDEQGPKAKFYWREVKAEPDLSRMADENYRRYLKKFYPTEEPIFANCQHQAVGKFTLAFAKADRQVYAATYQPETKMLLEWVFPAYSPAVVNRDVIPLLKTYVAKSVSDATQIWGLFGLEARIPAGYYPTEIAPRPADIFIQMENDKDHKLFLQRWGLPNVLLQGMKMEHMYAHVLKLLGAVVDEITPTTWNGHAAGNIKFRKRGARGMDKLMGGWWTGRGTIVHFEEEQRLVAFAQVVPKEKQLSVSFEDAFIRP